MFTKSYGGEQRSQFLLEGVPPHAHQPKILKYPQNENFIFS